MDIIEITLKDNVATFLNTLRDHAEFGRDTSRILWMVRVMPEGVRISRSVSDLITLADIMSVVADDAENMKVSLYGKGVSVTDLRDQAEAIYELVRDENVTTYGHHDDYDDLED
jgi:hypothetical protein